MNLKRWTTQCQDVNKKKRCFSIVLVIIMVVGVNTVYEQFQEVVGMTQRLINSDNTLLNDTSKVLDVDRKQDVDSKAVHHIGFLKVHKAGSTTMQNMFFRFGLNYNLTFMVSRSGNHIRRQARVLPIKHGSHYDIMAFHTIFNDELFSLLPKDRVLIAIVREPLDRTISAAYYCRHRKVRYLVNIPKENFIYNLIMHPELYDRHRYSQTKNTMAQDFGFARYQKRNQETDSKSLIQEYAKLLNSQFKLVMLLDRFLESLILLKRYLNWKMSDIIFLPTNKNAHSEVNVSEEEKLMNKKTNFLDYALYEFFASEFERKVNSEGVNFGDEVEHFQTVIDKTSQFCEEGSSSVLEILKSNWNEQFSITRGDCETMKMHELKFISKLRARHKNMHS